MSRKNIQDTNTRADYREYSKRRESSQICRAVAASENSKTEYKLSSTTFSICNQENKHFLDCTEIWISTPHNVLDEKETATYNNNKYREALKSLRHNIRFIENIQNLGTKNKTGKIIDFHYLKKNNFEYDANIRSKYSYQTVPRPITDADALVNKLISTLESSLQIIDSLEKNVDESQLKKYEATKASLFRQAKLFILLLQNDRIDLEIFARNIAFEDKKTSTYNRY